MGGVDQPVRIDVRSAKKVDQKRNPVNAAKGGGSAYTLVGSTLLTLRDLWQNGMGQEARIPLHGQKGGKGKITATLVVTNDPSAPQPGPPPAIVASGLLINASLKPAPGKAPKSKEGKAEKDPEAPAKFVEVRAGGFTLGGGVVGGKEVEFRAPFDHALGLQDPVTLKYGSASVSMSFRELILYGTPGCTIPAPILQGPRGPKRLEIKSVKPVMEFPTGCQIRFGLKGLLPKDGICELCDPFLRVDVWRPVKDHAWDSPTKPDPWAPFHQTNVFPQTLSCEFDSIQMPFDAVGGPDNDIRISIWDQDAKTAEMVGSVITTAREVSAFAPRKFSLGSAGRHGSGKPAGTVSVEEALMSYSPSPTPFSRQYPQPLTG